jgi:putative ABC transport system permease protein
VLVVIQVALSLVLVAGACLFVRSLFNLLTLDAGFRQDGLVIASLNLRQTGIPEAQWPTAHDHIIDRVRTLPGVEAAVRVAIVPISGQEWQERVLIGGKLQPGHSGKNQVGIGYFAAMGTQLLAGRDFDRRDTRESPRVAIVNQSFVRTYFGDANPIGQTFQVQGGQGVAQPFHHIIGLVTDTKYVQLREPFMPIFFVTSAQDAHPDASTEVILRSSAPVATVTSAVTREVSAIDPSISLRFDTMRAQVRESLLRERLMALLSAFFGALAALIAVIGLYGVMSYMVARRRTEIGIRMALGADSRAVVRLITREAGTLVIAGLIAGGVLAMVAARSAQALLFELQPSDPRTLGMAMIGLGTVAAIASWLPARRAARLDPTIALRED